jgi:hypothetical protein
MLRSFVQGDAIESNGRLGELAGAAVAGA